MGKLRVVCRPYPGIPCECEVFTINGKKAAISDFGSGYNDETKLCGDEDIVKYGCVNHIWRRNNLLAPKAMERYGITEKEFNSICDILEYKLSVGQCGWCI